MDERKPATADASAPRASVSAETVVLCDADGIVWSVSAGEECGQAIEVGRPLEHLLPERDRARFRACLRDSLQHGRAAQCECTDDGALATPIRECEITPLHDGSGTVAHVLVRLRTVAGYAGMRPLHGEERFELAMAHAQAAWFERDLSSDIGIGSRSLADLYGLDNPVGPWHYDEIRARILPEDRAPYDAIVDDALERAATDTEDQVLQYRIRRPDGTVRHLEVRYRNYFDIARPRAYGIVFDVTAAREGEQRLREQRDWLEYAAQAANILLWDVAIENREFRSSANQDTFFGVPENGSASNVASLFDLVHADDRDALRADFERLMQGVPGPFARFRVPQRGGESRWYEPFASIVRDADGHPLHLIGVTRDVTSEVQVSRALEQSEGSLHLALEQAHLSVFEWDLEVDSIHGPPGLGDILGLESRDGGWRGAALLDRIHADDRALLATAVAADGSTQTAATVEFRVVHPDGSIRSIETHFRHFDLARTGRGRVVGVIGDISERKAAETALRDSEASLNLALSTVAMSAFQWHIGTDVLRVTNRDETGPAGPTPPRTMSEFMALVHDDDRALVYAALDRVRNGATNASAHAEFRIFAQHSGKVLWLEVRLRRLDAAGNTSGVAVDITARREAESERRRLYEQLLQAQRVEAIGLLTDGIAHDFNNILAGILGYSKLAVRRFGDALPDGMTEYLGEIRSAGERARDLVQQLLTFSRGETVEMGSVDLTAVLAHTLRMLRPTVPSSIEFEASTASDLPTVRGNSVQLQQVLVNLCINARDALGGSGHIRISVERRRQARSACASCHLDFAGEFVVMSVTDDGQGIAAQDLPRVFEPFFSTKADSGHGSGMGLSMVHGLVHGCAGHILLHSAAGQGTRFEIFLPLATPAETGVATAGDAVAGRDEATGGAILVVDDEPAVAAFLGEMLEWNGYQVTVMNDPRAALAAFEHDLACFDLLLTDQTMPVMTGAELAGAVRALRPDLPVIVVSGYSASLDASSAAALGIDAMLAKPIDEAALLAAIAGALARRAPPG